MAKLVLQTRSWEQRRGGVRTSAFLVDMNRIFEDFVVVALREALDVSAYEFPQGAAGRRLHLDAAHKIKLEPDISWWANDHCQFIGDLKYKRVSVPGIKHADLYQLLSYCVATRLPGGLLIYAKGEGAPVTHEVVNVGKHLQVIALDLEQEPAGVLAQIASIAGVIRALRTRQCSPFGTMGKLARHDTALNHHRDWGEAKSPVSPNV